MILTDRTQRIRANCISGMFTDGETGKIQIINELKGVIVYYEEMIGLIPPVLSFDDFCEQVKQTQQSIPDKKDVKEIIKLLYSLTKDWVSIYFFPIEFNSKSIEKNRLTQIYVKSGSLWGKSIKGTGFFEYNKMLKRNQIGLSDVATHIFFDKTHKFNKVEIKGLQFRAENISSNPDTINIMAEIKQWIELLEKSGSNEIFGNEYNTQLLTLNPEQSLEYLHQDDRKEICSYIISNIIFAVLGIDMSIEDVLTILN